MRAKRFRLWGRPSGNTRIIITATAIQTARPALIPAMWTALAADIRSIRIRSCRPCISMPTTAEENRRSKADMETRVDAAGTITHGGEIRQTMNIHTPTRRAPRSRHIHSAGIRTGRHGASVIRDGTAHAKSRHERYTVTAHNKYRLPSISYAEAG